MKCVITGSETHLKHKNIPISREALERAKLIRNAPVGKAKRLTLLQAIGELAKAMDRKEA